MNKLVLLPLVVVASAACQPDTKNLEKQARRAQQEARSDARAGGGAAVPARRAAAPAARPSPIARRPTRCRSTAIRSTARPTRRSRSSRRTTTRARTARRSATRWTSSARSTATICASSTSSSSSTRRSRPPARSRSAPPTSRASSSQIDTLLWDKGFKGRQFDKDAPAAEAGGQAAEVLGVGRGLPGRARLRAGARPQRRQVQGRHEGRVPALDPEGHEGAAGARRRRDAVVLHQRPLPVGRDADRELRRADRRGAQEGERARSSRARRRRSTTSSGSSTRA